MSNEHKKKKIILLADDDQDDCFIFQEALSEVNIETELTITKDGEQLMETLDQTVPPIPDVIFLDLNMPRKNGMECLSEIRSSHKLKEIPVVIFSTSHNQQTVNEMYELGANYYICKPNDFLKLKNVLQTVLSLPNQLMISQPGREQFFLTNV